MKRGILLFMAVLPAAVMGQQNIGLTSDEAGSAIAVQPSSLVRGSDDPSPLETRNAPTLDSTWMQAPTQSQQQNGKQPQPAKPKTDGGHNWPSTGGSMVGYIDNAIVGSQVRIRFDDGFHDSAPDRAEFFYPQCACTIQGAPGPDFPGASTNVNFQELYFQVEYAPVSRFSILRKSHSVG